MAQTPCTGSQYKGIAQISAQQAASSRFSGGGFAWSWEASPGQAAPLPPTQRSVKTALLACPPAKVSVDTTNPLCRIVLQLEEGFQELTEAGNAAGEEATSWIHEGAGSSTASQAAFKTWRIASHTCWPVLLAGAHHSGARSSD